MSISQKKLEAVFDPIRYTSGETVSIEIIKEKLSVVAENYGLPLHMENDEIEIGGFFSSETEPCLAFYHPEHEDDYYNFCITVKTQGKTALVSTFSFGKSSQMSKEAFAQNTKVFDGAGSRGTTMGILRGGAVGAGFAIGSAATGIVKGGVKALAKGINALTMDKAALAKEKEWYELLYSVLEEVLG